MTNLMYTPLEDIPSIHEKLYKTFRSGRCRPFAYRRSQLHALVRLCQENADAIAAALYADLRKPRLEAVGFELVGAVSQAFANAQHLEAWARPERIPDAALAEHERPLRPTVHKTPKGPVLAIVPWNFPFYNCCLPLITAIATGNPAVIKPSEVSAHAAQLFAELLHKYLDPEAYVVVNGAVPETTRLLELKWAHILYTGNGRVARIISAAAAKHLTPVTLELGGKSPVIVDTDSCDDLQLVAKRILLGKTINAGQICVAPDYILIHKDKQDALIDAFKQQLAVLYPNGQLNDPCYSGIVSATHFARLSVLLAGTRGKVVLGGGKGEKTLQFETTVVKDVDGDDTLMSEEIFGPLLPIIPISSIDEAIDFVNEREHPLALYVFTENEELKERFLNETISGGIQFNCTIQQVPALPFGGVGESGHGVQNLKHGFDDLTHNRACLEMPKESEALMSMRYPPYTEQAYQKMCDILHQPIPE